jgi:hypothetical protein
VSSLRVRTEDPKIFVGFFVGHLCIVDLSRVDGALRHGKLVFGGIDA